MKRVVITGGASGIGRRLATGFAAAGYEVFALDKKNTTFTEEHIRFLPMDLEDESQIHQCFQSIIKQHGEIHVLINNGAVSKFHKPVFELTPQEFDWVIRTNLRGAFLCCREFIAQHSPGAYGRIINIASTRFHQNEAGWEAYGASKGGVVSLTNSLCVSLSDRAVTVNAISPGWIETGDYDALTEADHKQHPSGRVGKPADILRACLFLAAAESDFINGINLVVDGGMTKRMIYVE